jgi:hypothetical protein
MLVSIMERIVMIALPLRQARACPGIDIYGRFAARLLLDFSSFTSIYVSLVIMIATALAKVVASERASWRLARCLRAAAGDFGIERIAMASAISIR